MCFFIEKQVGFCYNLKSDTIKAGDMVLSTDIKTGETGYKKVVETYVRETMKLVHLKVNGEEIVTTEGHPFYVKDIGFVNACELSVGDKLTDSNGKVMFIESVNTEVTDETVRVYNFQVEDYHTYYVSDECILVHNADGNYSTTKLKKSISDINAKAKQGKIKYAKNYHGRLGSEMETELLSNPDAVYVAENKAQNFIFRKGDDVVIVESTGSSKGNVITSYGPSGAGGNSGAAIFGGNPSDPGMPVTHDMIVNGTIPTPSGETLPPATQLYP